MKTFAERFIHMTFADKKECLNYLRLVKKTLRWLYWVGFKESAMFRVNDFRVTVSLIEDLKQVKAVTTSYAKHRNWL